MALDRVIPPPRTIRFGPFELDVRAAELRKHGIRIRLHEQPCRILLMLLNHSGEVVLRDEIRQALWPNNTVVEFDHSINAAIQRLRDALSDSADKPRYVETVARRGYRFIGTVEAEAPAPQVEVPALPADKLVSGVDPSDLSGQAFSHFRVIAKLGSGGMGVVYRAEDLKLGRHVALKFLALPAHEAPSGLLERFQREARAASALNHPNICTIYGVDTFAGQPVIVMELLEGETLEARLAKGPLAMEKALPLSLQLAAALDAAHRKGIVHRDLKPANIMVAVRTPAGPGLKVLDFGLAKVERAIEGEEETLTGLTQAGTILGTWQYMSPEQAQGKDADARSDLFSFGCILLEMLTGRRAFTGGTPAELISAILMKDPLEGANLAHALECVIRHCLEKSPEDRFQTAHDLAFALETIPGGSPASATAPVPAAAGQRRFHRRVAAAAIVVLIAAVGAWWAAGRSRSGWPTKVERLTFRRERVQGARFAPDGRSVIYASYREGRPVELFSIQPGRPESTRPLGFPSTGLLDIAPSGEMAVSTNCSSTVWGGGCRGTLGEMNVAGGAPREILDNVTFADWTPDGKQLAVCVLAANGKPNRLEFPVGKALFEATGTGWPGDPRVSPQGDMVAFLDHFQYGNDGSVAVVDLRGRKRTLTRTFGDVGGLAWSPSGKEIWFTGASELGLDSIYAVTLSGAMRTVAQMPADLRLQDIAPDGRVLLTTLDDRAGVYFLGPGESSARELTWLDFGTFPILSADGKRMLLTEAGEATYGKSTLFIRGTDGSPAVRLGDDLTGGSISPDGEWATARTYNQGPDRLVLVPLKAGKSVAIDIGSLELVRQVVNGTPSIAWFPGSRRILFPAREPGHRTRTFVQDINGGPPRPVTPEGISGTVLTVDGTTLLAWDEEPKAFLYPLNGGTPKPLPFLTPDYYAIRFSADGRSLYVTKRRSSKVWQIDLASGRAELWRELPYVDPAGLTDLRVEGITQDGKSLAYIVFRTLSKLYLVEGLK